jgi:type IV pilus assembly protein PilA
VKCALPYVVNTIKYLKRGVKPLMPTRVKGLTSIEVAILVAVVLAIAVAVGWYLYTTLAVAVTAQPNLRVVSVIAWQNGTIKIVVHNAGSGSTFITHGEVFNRIIPVREGGWAWLGPGGMITVHIDVGDWVRPGTIIQGKLITSDGQSVPFSVRVSA